jgi:carboxypeptidase Taq
MGDKLEKLREMLGEVADLSHASALLGWDQQTYMPPGGAKNRAMQLATLNSLAHSKFVSDEMGNALDAASREIAGADADSDQARLIKKTRHDYDKQSRVPTAWVAEFSRTGALAHPEWEKARADANFSIFQPLLEKLIALRREYVDFFAPYDHVYDPLLDDFEPGMKTTEVKAVFDALRPRQVELVRAITEDGAPVDDSVVRQNYDIQKQWDFGVEVITALGYDFKHGRQDKSVHPFTTSFGIGDVRITTRFVPDFLNTSLFGSMHEAGHGMYEQGINPELGRTPLADGASLSIHESQSRMWENLVGRSRPFWKAFFPRLQSYFPELLENVDLETFYRAINKVQRSFIRVDADEATYNLHVMLRFELEIALMEGDLSVGDLPEAWNSKFEEFMGLTPPDDAKGVLQDIHWSFGGFGYFSTYALGNLVASQLWEKILSDIPDMNEKIESADFNDLLQWLRENIHQYGAKYEPIELLKRVTGKELDYEPYMVYLETKFKDIYQL